MGSKPDTGSVLYQDPTPIRPSIRTLILRWLALLFVTIVGFGVLIKMDIVSVSLVSPLGFDPSQLSISIPSTVTDFFSTSRLWSSPAVRPYAWPLPPQIPLDDKCYSSVYSYTCNTNVTRHWAQYSPAFSSHTEVDAKLDGRKIRDQCELRHVSAVFRHGSRSPTYSRAVVIRETVSRLQNTVDPKYLVGPWAFLRDYVFDMVDDAGELSVFGQQELFSAGRRFQELFGDFAAESRKKSGNKGGLFIRAGGISRVVMSAMNFSDGYFFTGPKDRDLGPIPTIIEIPEYMGVNNTLKHAACDSYERGTHKKVAKGHHVAWAETELSPIGQRIGAELGGVDISYQDVIDLIELCAFATVRYLADDLTRIHPSCAPFTVDDLKKFDYYHSLAKYYRFSLGDPLAAAQGVGYVRELFARILGQPVQPGNSVNITLDSDPATFPVGPGHDVFADFSHDNSMLTILAALGLHPTPLPVDKYTPPHLAGGYAVKELTNFASRFYFEVHSCDDQGQEEENRENWWISLKVNERIVPLTGCAEHVFDEDAAAGVIPSACRVGKLIAMIDAQGDFGWDQCYVDAI